MSDVEQRVSKIEGKLEDIETSRQTERREYLDVMERIWSKLNDLHVRLTVQSEHANSIKELSQRITTLENSSQQVSGGWKAMGIVGTAMLAFGAFLAWALDHAPTLIKKLTTP